MSFEDISEDVTVTILPFGPDSQLDNQAVMRIPRAHLEHYARRPEAWLRAVCTWIAGCNGTLEASTDGEEYTPVSFPSLSGPIKRFYRFTSGLECTHLPCLVQVVITDFSSQHQSRIALSTLLIRDNGALKAYIPPVEHPLNRTRVTSFSLAMAQPASSRRVYRLKRLI
jgi:hypothetical protein